VTCDERTRALREVQAWVRQYGEINFEICGDNILMDPCLHGLGFSPENVAISNECSALSTIHSAKYHACEEIAGHIESMIESGVSGIYR
jgi:hypothetical protein